MITFNVCGIAEVPRFSQAGLTDIVSIGNKGTHLPDLSGFSLIPEIHRLEFDDLGHVCDIGPQKQHVEKLIEIADSLIARKEDVRVLYHCHAGISRSTAGLFILLVRGGATYQQAYDNILAIRGVLSPNILIVKHADILMNQDGKMLDFIASFKPEAQEWVKLNGYNFE